MRVSIFIAFQSVSVLAYVTSPSHSPELSLVQNAPPPTDVMLLGMKTFLRLLQPTKALSSIVSTPSFMVIVSRASHPLKATFGIVLRLPGIVILLRAEQFAKEP